MPRSTKHEKTNEDGFAAIIVTLIIMAILVLITIGFVRIVSREQRSALDRQLSTQAFYAAETGVNDAAEMLASRLENGDPLEDKTDCDVDSSWPADPLLDGDDVRYTCILIDPAPTSLEYGAIDQQTPQVIHINGVDENGDQIAIDNLRLSWQSEPFPGAPALSGAGSDLPSNFGNAAPVLRVTLTPLSNMSRQALIENTMTVFLRPASSGGAASATGFSAGAGEFANQGRIIQVTCDVNDDVNPRICNHRISGLAAAGTAGYLMTVRSVYSNASLYIEGQGVGSDVLRFANQQAIIDSTGRASDVLRRIQVRVPLRETFDYPGFALEGASICKPYSVGPGFGESEDGDCNF